MKHPSSAKVFEWVGLLEKVSKPGQKCHMGHASASAKHPCHGCLALLAFAIEPDFDCTDFKEGVKALNSFFYPESKVDFAYPFESQLCEWAHVNPDLWGAGEGRFMFSSRLAFEQECDCFPVQVLIDHWRGVGERLKAIEEGK